MKKFEAETGVPYSAQASSSASWTIDIWRDLYRAPGLAALGTGFALALFVVLVVDATDMPVTLWGLARLLLIVWLGSAVFLFWGFYTGAVQRFERRTGIDYNGDGRIGDEPIAPATPVIIPVEVVNDSGKWTGEDKPRIENLSHLQLLAREWKNGNPINQTAGEKLMLRADYNALRDQLINGSFAEWVSARDTKHGWKLTRRGEALFRNIADRL